MGGIPRWEMFLLLKKICKVVTYIGFKKRHVHSIDQSIQIKIYKLAVKKYSPVCMTKASQMSSAPT